MLYFDPMYFLYLAPALLLAMWAQFRIHSAYNQAQQMAAPLSGAAAARHILDSAGLTDVEIEEIPGQLTDHYDPRERVLRLSPEVYESRTLAAVGIAAHESGHALQHARGYAPLAIRNAAVPAAGIGTQISFPLILLGFFLNMRTPLGAGLIYLGIGLFATVVVFQVINLPVEFNASSRAKAQLVGLGIVNDEQLKYVSKVLNAAALTYVAATLVAILTLLYYIMRFTGGGRRD
jgi:uncharacterized protein